MKRPLTSRSASCSSASADIGIRGGALASRRTLPARITLEVTGAGAPIVVEGEIALD
jgi:hypothetical protein